MQNKAVKILCTVFALLWLSVLAVLGCMYFFGNAGGEFLESENRTLAPRPALTADSLWSGEFSSDVEDFLSDHIVGRSTLIPLCDKIKNALSLATDDDIFMLSLREFDQGDEHDIEPAEERENTEVTTDNAVIYTEAPETTKSPQTTGSPEITESPEGTRSPEDTSSPAETATPVTTEEVTAAPATEVAIPPKTPGTAADFPNTLTVSMKAGGKVTTLLSYSKSSVLAMADTLEKIAAVLPEDGHVIFTTAQQSGYGNRYVNAANREYFRSEPEKLVDAVTSDKIRAFSLPDILGPLVDQGKYIYFRTDLHMTAEAAYAAYSQAITLAGKKPANYSDFNKTTEENFRGTLYRDNPAKYASFTPDTLDIVSPKFSVEVRRITGKGQYKILPFIDLNAPKNDRYCVYLGGPYGPWTYTVCDNGKTDNCLVIGDSFAMIYQVFLTANYGQVHYMHPSDFSQKTVGYTVGEMMEKYNIKDVYVILADFHSYGKSTLANAIKNQLN